MSADLTPHDKLRLDRIESRLRQAEQARRNVATGLGLAVVLATAASGAAAYLWKQTDELEQTLKSQTDSIEAAQRRVGDIERELGSGIDLGSVAGRVARLEGDLDAVRNSTGSSSLTSIDDRVRSLEADMTFIAGFGGQLEQFVSLADEVDDLRACVNLYMDTVAQAGSGAYTYYRC